MLGGYSLWFSQFSSVAQSYLTLCNPMDCSVRGLPVHYQLPELKLESVMPSNHLIFCHTPFLLHSIFPSIKVFSNESVLCIGWPKYWNIQLCESQKTVENSERDGNTRPPDLPPRNGHGTMDWFKIGKGVCQGCILSPCLF